LDLVTVVPCSTNLLGEGSFRVNLNERERLDAQCEAMVEQVRGISKKRIIYTLGLYNKEEMKKISLGLKSLLSL